MVQDSKQRHQIQFHPNNHFGWVGKTFSAMPAALLYWWWSRSFSLWPNICRTYDIPISLSCTLIFTFVKKFRCQVKGYTIHASEYTHLFKRVFRVFTEAKGNTFIFFISLFLISKPIKPGGAYAVLSRPVLFLIFLTSTKIWETRCW